MKKATRTVSVSIDATRDKYLWFEASKLSYRGGESYDGTALGFAKAVGRIMRSVALVFWKCDSFTVKIRR